MKVFIICIKCGKQALCEKSAKSRRLYCSRECKNKKVEYSCKECGKVWFGQLNTLGRKNFCSKPCLHKWNGRRQTEQGSRAVRKCKICHAEFERNAVHGKYQECCSTACSGIAKRKEPSIFCGYCGKAFHRSPSRIIGGFCSRACFGLASRIEKKLQRCVKCGKDFSLIRRRFNARFCSKKCLVKRGFDPTDIEAKTYKALEELGISYQPQKRFGHYYADAFIPELNIVIEVNGDYWHCNPSIYTDGAIDRIQARSIERDKRKLSYLRNENVKVLTIWESEINQYGAKVLLEKALMATPFIFHKSSRFETISLNL